MNGFDPLRGRALDTLRSLRPLETRSALLFYPCEKRNLLFDISQVIYVDYEDLTQRFIQFTKGTREQWKRRSKWRGKELSK